MYKYLVNIIINYYRSLANNYLEELPQQFGNLKNLKYLYYI